MLYFALHPTVSYDLGGHGDTQRATNITSRVTLAKLVEGIPLVYYDYVVKDGERPDTVAYKYYGDERLDWVVYLSNHIHDPYFQWPMEHEVFRQYLAQAYGSVQNAQQTVHHYTWLVETKRIAYTPEGEAIQIEPKTLEVDQATYNTLANNVRGLVTVYDYEDALNEQRRRIHLVDRDFVPAIERRIRILYA